MEITWEGMAYLILFGCLFVLEVIAIITNKYDTISEKIWKVSKPHLALRVFIFCALVWGAFHLAFGECAFGLCFK